MVDSGFGWDNFQMRVAEAVRDGIASGRTAAAAVRAMKRAAGLAEEALAWHRRMRMKLACAPGCGTCCAVHVALLIPEAIGIASFLRRRLAEEGGRYLRERLDDVSSRVRWVDAEERNRLGIPCAFLDARGRCSIYPVRPLTCRSITSTDAELCRRALNASFLDEEEPILMDLFQKFLFDETFRTVARTLEELGLDSRSLELTGGVKAFLDSPSLATAFLRGERVRFQ